jgi:anti-sigma-K factor RskA
MGVLVMENELHLLDLIPAYALGCLDREESREVEAHLSNCAECQTALLSYQELVGQMAYSVPQVNPPAGVKEALMAQVQAGWDTSPAALPRKSWWERLWDSMPRLTPSWAIASLVVIGFLVISNLLLWNQVRDLRTAQNHQMLVVALNGAGVAPQSSGKIVISRDGQYGTLVVDQLPVLDESQQYQLWLIKDGQRTSGGVFSVSDHGYSSLEIWSPQPLGSYDSFGITIEPYGGSPGPTGDKVLGGDL